MSFRGGRLAPFPRRREAARSGQVLNGAPEEESLWIRKSDAESVRKGISSLVANKLAHSGQALGLWPRRNDKWQRERRLWLEVPLRGKDSHAFGWRQ